MLGKRAGGDMAFTVVWLRGPSVIGSEDFEELSSATEHADGQLSQMQTRFGATAVKVVDEEGVPHFLRAISRNA
jgi:hypothetical protein